MSVVVDAEARGFKKKGQGLIGSLLLRLRWAAESGDLEAIKPVLLGGGHGGSRGVCTLGVEGGWGGCLLRCGSEQLHWKGQWRL